MKIESILILGGGSAGFMAAVTLKRKLPHLDVTIVRSPDLGIIGVGEGTSTSFAGHFFQYLKLKPKQFYAEAEPTWKLGIKFLWGGARPEFNYSFAMEYGARLDGLERNAGFYVRDGEVPCLGYGSALMQANRAFTRQSNGQLQFHNSHAFHIENHKLVRWLEGLARQFGIKVIDATVTAQQGEEGIAALVLPDGTRLTADLYVDASGFRSELLEKTLGVPFVSYADTLFCDRAVIGGWERTDEVIQPYTTAETMDCGWCWRIDHETFINRGYVYASNFIGDDAAREEFLRCNPRVAKEPRVVRFRAGRLASNWVKNVVGVGNSVGFVEPLEATALHIVSSQACTLTDALLDSACEPSPSIVEFYNDYAAHAWDSIRDFLSIHYRFNQRRDTPFWKAARAETAMHGAQPIVDFYRENGPSVLAAQRFIHPSNTFGIEGYLTLLIGQGVPHAKRWEPRPGEAGTLDRYRRSWETAAAGGFGVKEALGVFRSGKMRWE